MILGTGLIATAFLESKLPHDELLVFAKGVSDSTCENEEEYKKELSLIKENLKAHPDLKFVYFSTASILQGKKSRYVKFKKEVENYIEKHSSNYLILRLPNVVGKKGNKKQLIPYLYNALINEEKIEIVPGFFRFLVDVEDIPLLVSKLRCTNTTLTVTFNNDISVMSIVSCLEDIVGKKYTRIKVTQGTETEIIEDATFKKELGNSSNLFNTRPYNILKKYYENFSSSIHE